MIRRSDQPFVESVARLAYCNPFLPERIEHERAALGPRMREEGARPRGAERRLYEDLALGDRLQGHAGRSRAAGGQ